MIRLLERCRLSAVFVVVGTGLSDSSELAEVSPQLYWFECDLRPKNGA